MTEQSPASPWCQRWNGRQQSWRHTSEGGFDPARYRVEPIPELVAKAYVVDNHYSGTYPAASQRYGMFDGEQLVGVCVLGIPASKKVLTGPFPGLTAYTETLELSRFVLADECPANSETWFLTRCFSEAAQEGVRGVVSFADPMPRTVGDVVLFPGHVGTIYQAKGAIHTGRATARTLMVLPSGEVLNDRSMQKVRKQERGHDHVEKRLIGLGARTIRANEKPATWLTEAIEAVGTVKIRHRGNHRYCFALGTKSQRRRCEINGAPLPYPKERDT